MGKAQMFERLKRAHPGIFDKSWYYNHKKGKIAFKFVLSQNARGKTRYHVEHLAFHETHASLTAMVHALLGKKASVNFYDCYVSIPEYKGHIDFVELEENARFDEWKKKFDEHKADIKKLTYRESVGLRMPWETRRSLRLASPALKEVLESHKPE